MFGALLSCPSAADPISLDMLVLLVINRVWSGLLKDNLNRVHQLNKHLLYFCREEENEGDVAGNAEAADVQSTA